MSDVNQNLSKEGLANLAIDPDLLARELAAQLAGDPLDEIELDNNHELFEIVNEILNWNRKTVFNSIGAGVYGVLYYHLIYNYADFLNKIAFGLDTCILSNLDFIPLDSDLISYSPYSKFSIFIISLLYTDSNVN